MARVIDHPRRTPSNNPLEVSGYHLKKRLKLVEDAMCNVIKLFCGRFHFFPAMSGLQIAWIEMKKIEK